MIMKAEQQEAVVIHVGSNQAPGGTCTHAFHLTACDPGFDPDMAAARQTGNSCPACGAVMMPGSAVWPAFATEYKRRLAAKICVASRGGKFLDSRKASHEAIAGGSCLCARHNRG